MNNPGPSAPLTISGLRAEEAEIFASIEAAIVEQRLLPGTRLIEEELSAIYDVSRMRVRRVLLALAHAGLIVLHAGRGAQVARPSAGDARAVFGARRLIEGALLATPERPDRRAIKNLQNIVRREHAAARAADRAAMIQLSGAFHVELARASGNPVIADIVASLVARSSLIVALFQTSAATCCRSDDHARLIDALVAREATVASTLMRQHLDAIEGGLSFADEAVRNHDLRGVLIRPGRRPGPAGASRPRPAHPKDDPHHLRSKVGGLSD